ncbi:MAG: EAL domain-containing protein, partial [Pygmaiobacter sp.]
ERKGFITRLDWFVREQVCCYIKRSKREHPELKIVPISVNLSRMNFYHTEFPNEVIAQTQQYGVLPSEIKFEITESAYTDNPGELLRAMKILQDYGFEIMMDDFGSGYSSLNMLKDVPVDVLKIDMKFVDDIEVSNRARNVMASVVRMAKWLDMSVIAEGVETRTQIDFLRSIGCDRVQGFYFSKPLSLTDFTELILSAPPVRYADGDILEKIDFDTLFYDNREINLVMDGMIGFMGIYELRIAALEVVRVNKGYYELFGNAAFATSRDVMENVMPADRVALLQKCHDAEISLRVERLALRSYRENKIVFWLDLRVRYLGKRNGNSIFYFAGHDITKQKEMEQANAQGSYLLALRNVYDEIFSFTDGDNCLRSLYADAQCINPDMEGIELRLQLESYASRYVHPEDRERFLRLSRREIVFAQLSDPQGVVPDFKVRVLRRDGRYHWILRTILAAGEVFGKQNFLICIRNIDQEYLAEKIAAENQQLRAMKRIDERYRVIAEQTNTIVMDWDLVTGEFFAGEGYEQYEMSVHTMEMSFHATLPEGVVHPQDKDILIRFLEHLENNDVFEQAVLRLKKSNGKYVWVRITGTSIFDQMGKLVRVIGTINEVDAEKRSALLLAETKEQLEQLVENLPIGVGIYELENEVLLRYENRQARALLGIEQGTELYSEKCREQVAQHY